MPSPITFTLLTLFVAFALYSSSANALLEELPFIGDKYPFRLTFEQTLSNGSDLNAVIKEQRGQSAEFKAISSATRAARFDRDTIKRWLESQGYFAYQVSSDLSDPEKIRHNIQSGPRYFLAEISIHSPESYALASKVTLPLKKGKPLMAEQVLQARDAIRDYVEAHFCLFHIEVNYSAEINHQTQDAFVTFTLQPSPSVTFATPQIIGTDQVETEFLKNYLTVEKGECFKRKQIELSRLALLQSNLLSRVELNIAEPQNNQVVVTFDVTERSHRTLKAGIGYDTNTGPGITLGWQHRNLLHRGEKFDIETHFNEILTEVGAELVKPHFMRANQTLTLTNTLSREKPDAYDYTYGEVAASLNRPLSRNWAGNVGLSLEFSRDEREEEKSDYALLSAPISFDFNDIANILNPVNGWVVNFQVRPFIDLYDENIAFTKSSTSLSAYFSARGLPGSPVLALRAAVGSIDGEALNHIPSKHRYYVGGGGSVRGYRYQSVGELEDQDDKNNVPVGGLSFGEAAAEIRFRFNPQWGAVIFADGGYAYPDKRPDFGKDFLWGYGIGLRYFTSFAPIRFDIATPDTVRQDDNGERIDDDVQLYISIGQAF